MSTPRKPDLDHLVTALTAEGRPDELTGRGAAAAAFRTANWRDAADGTARRRRLSIRRPLIAIRPALAAIACVVVVAAGFAAAAYTRALPGPAQDLAHTVFAPLGVPDNQQPGQNGQSAAVTNATSTGKSGRSRGASSRTPSPRPGDAYLLTLSASRLRVPAGATVELAGRVADRGRVAADVPVRLFERLAGSTTWQLEASGVTGPRGGFRLLSPPLTTTAVFRVVGPDNTHSAAVRVTVVRVKVTAGAGAT